MINPNKEIQAIKTYSQATADKVTAYAGTMKFVAFHIVWFGMWITVNTGLFGEAMKFDEFPFGFLTLTVSLEAIFLSAFVMISQNRQGVDTKLRAELDYQVNVKAEQETDVIVKMLERIAQSSEIEVDDLLSELSEARKMAGLKRG